MAIFDWKCECGFIFEEITLQGEKEPDTCPKCKEKKLTKCMGASMAIFNGNGFPTWDSRVANSIKEMQKDHKKKSYLKTNDGINTAHDKTDQAKIKNAFNNSTQ